MRNRPVANHIAGVFKKAGIDPAMQRQLDLAGVEWPMSVRQVGRDGFRHDFRVAIAALFSLAVPGLFRRAIFRLFGTLDRQFRLVRFVLSLLRHVQSLCCKLSAHKKRILCGKLVGRTRIYSYLVGSTVSVRTPRPGSAGSHFVTPLVTASRPPVSLAQKFF